MHIEMAKPEHEVLYQELVALVTRHATKMTPAEILAVAANMIGKLIAMQDQRILTPVEAMTLVSENIVFGNEQALELVKNGKAGSA